MRLGFNLIRGSSSKKAIQSLKKLVNILKKTNYVGITPDGPRGPKEVFKEGALYLSYLSGVPVYLVGVGIKKYIELPTWDRFKIPLPFTKCVIFISSPFYIKNKSLIKKELFENLLKDYDNMAKSYLFKR